MTSFLTEKEQRILQLRAKGTPNVDIANELGTSQADISQTFKRISQKITNVNDTLKLLRETNLVEQSTPIKLTPKGISEIKRVAQLTHREIPTKHSVKRSAPPYSSLMAFKETSSLMIDNENSIWLARLSTMLTVANVGKLHKPRLVGFAE